MKRYFESFIVALTMMFVLLTGTGNAQLTGEVPEGLSGAEWEKIQSVINEQVKLTASDGAADDLFGNSVSISDVGGGGACETDTVYSDDFNEGSLNAKWSSGDYGIIEEGGPAGYENVTDDPGMLTVGAAGSSIWGDSDKYHFVYQQISGDFDISLYVHSIPPNCSDLE